MKKRFDIPVIGYGRVSTKGQLVDREGERLEDSSPEAQKAKILKHLEYLDNKCGVKHRFVEFISDEGYSGKNDKRPGYKKLLRLIKTNQVKKIIASELSRLSRDVKDFLDLAALCKKHDVDLIIIGMDLDTSTAFGEFMLVVLVALAAFERQMTAKRVQDNVRIRLLQGKINGSSPVLGLRRIKNGHFEIDSETVKTLKKVLKFYLDYPTKQMVLNKCKELGIKNINGKDLNQNTLNRMIENCEWRYAGKWYVNIENRELNQDELNEDEKFKIVDLPHGAVLPETLRAAVLEKHRRTKKHIKSGKDREFYLLSGLLVAEDGSNYSGQQAKYKRYYYNSQIKDRIQVEIIEPIIEKELQDHITNQDKFIELVEQTIKTREGELPQIDLELRQIKKKLDGLEVNNQKIRAKFLESNEDLVMDWLKSEIEKMGIERDQLLAQQEILVKGRERLLERSGLDNLQQKIKSLLNEFSKKSSGEKKEVFGQLINKIVVRKDNKLEIHFHGDAPPEFRAKKILQSGGTKKLFFNENGGSVST